MKKFIPLLLVAGFGAPAMADITHSISSSVQLNVNAAATQGDAISSNAPTTGAVANYSDVTSTGSGSAGDLAGTILTSGAMTLTAGGSGTVATVQFVNDLTID